MNSHSLSEAVSIKSYRSMPAFWRAIKMRSLSPIQVTLSPPLIRVNTG